MNNPPTQKVNHAAAVRAHPRTIQPASSAPIRFIGGRRRVSSVPVIGPAIVLSAGLFAFVVVKFGAAGLIGWLGVGLIVISSLTIAAKKL